MPESPKPSINSWLEDELYHQYLHDRQTVDADWKQMFDSNGHAIPANGKTVTAVVATIISNTPIDGGSGVYLISVAAETPNARSSIRRAPL